MSFLILVRHGQSIWNLEKKFTGWVDVDLTEHRKLEAEKAGALINNLNIKQLFDVFDGTEEQAEIKNNTINNKLILKILI